MNRLIKGLKKTKNKFINPLMDLFSSGSLDESAIEKAEELLFSADLGFDATERIVNRLRERDRGGGEVDLSALLKSELLDIMGGAPDFSPSQGTPRVIVIVGVNGVGKTSTIGKLARYFLDENKSVILAACDTFRAAAIDQLQLWAEKAGVPVVRQKMGSDPAAVAFDAVTSARARGTDLVIVDTAGRLHTKKNLMQELEKIFRVLEKRIEGIGLEGWLVIDGNSGQNSIRQAEAFVERLPINGMVITKLDSTAKGGAVIPIQSKLGLPVVFVGTGEGLRDLGLFDHEAFVSALIGE